MKAIIVENSQKIVTMLLKGSNLMDEVCHLDMNTIRGNHVPSDHLEKHPPHTVPTESDVLEYVSDKSVNLAVLDVTYMGIRAFQLGEQLRRRYPEMMILYVSDADNHLAVMEAIRDQRAAYVLKPVVWKDLEYAIDTARLLTRNREKRIFIRTFGNFELFVDGRPVIFKTSKAKELLALLVDRRGGIVTSEQAIGTLWEYRANDEASRSLYSKVGKSLTNALEEVGAEDLVMTSRGMKSINIDILDCDFYQLMDGDERAKRNYFGRYMADYSWAEYRVPVLDRMCSLD